MNAEQMKENNFLEGFTLVFKIAGSGLLFAGGLLSFVFILSLPIWGIWELTNNEALTRVTIFIMIVVYIATIFGYLYSKN